MGRTLIAIALVLFGTGSAAAASPTAEYDTKSVAQLIDDLVNVDAETLGLHGSAFFNNFMAEDKSNILTISDQPSLLLPVCLAVVVSAANFLATNMIRK